MKNGNKYGTSKSIPNIRFQRVSNVITEGLYVFIKIINKRKMQGINRLSLEFKITS